LAVSSIVSGSSVVKLDVCPLREEQVLTSSIELIPSEVLFADQCAELILVSFIEVSSSLLISLRFGDFLVDGLIARTVVVVKSGEIVISLSNLVDWEVNWSLARLFLQPWMSRGLIREQA